MAFSVSTKRSKTQDSPTFWLSLIAGSLALHLVLLLVGRWYFSQTASTPAGTSQAPLDFVEIDPNAPPLKQPIAPSNTQTQAELPKAAPPQESVTEATQAPNAPGSSAIANLPRQAAPERSQSRTAPSPSPSPTTPINQPNRSQPTPSPGQLPSDRTTPNQNPTVSPRPTTPAPNPGATNPATPGASTPGTAAPGATTPSPGTTTPGTTTPSPGSPGSTRPETPTTSTPGGESSGETGSPVGSGESLLVATNIQGRVTGQLQEDTFRPEQYAKGTVTLKSAELQEIEFDFPGKLPVTTLDLRIGLVITPQGQVVDARVLDDSPTLRNNPDLDNPQSRADIQSIVNALVLQANADGSLAFDVKLESKDADAYRILPVQIDLKQ